MGYLNSRKFEHAISGTPAYFMSKNYGPRSYKYLQKWQNLTKNSLNYNGHCSKCPN